MTYTTAAPTYRANGFAPIPVQQKSPVPKGSTGRLGTVTDEKIAEWCASDFWGGQNIALRAEGWISIDVDHGYEYIRINPETQQPETATKRGADDLAELETQLGLLPSTITSTARGGDSPSRQHFYAVPAGLEFLTKPADDIEVVQHGHRYAIVWPSVHPDTGETYQWFGYDGQLLTEPPKLSDFEPLPEAWLEYLTVPAPTDSHAGFGGSIKAWLDVLPKGDPSPKVAALIRDIPTVEFGHDTLVRLTFRIVRLGAENHPGVHEAIDALYDAWTRPPFEAYAPAFTVAVEGAIRKAGKPQAPLPKLMRSVDALNDTTAEFIEMLPKATPGQVAAAAHELGLSDSHVLTLMWNSPAGQLRQMEPEALEAMWREALSVRVAPPALPPVESPSTGLSLLSDAEREAVSSYTWWGTQYLEWVRGKLDYFNAPMHKLGRWAVISSIASPWGHTAIKGPRPTHAALYLALPAPSTVGKSDALGFVETCIAAFHGTKSGVNLGMMSKLTSVALHRALLVRDGQASFVYTDEAQAFLREIQDSKWHGSLLGDIADYYGGHVGAKQMMNDKEMSGVEGKTFLTTYMTGIDDQMLDAMDLSMWTSGLFYRFVWAIADPRQPDLFNEEQADPSFAGEHDPMPAQWAAEFRNAQMENELLGKYRQVSYDDDAWIRHREFRRAMDAQLRSHPRYTKIIEPALIRFSKSIIKCATLVALIEASPTVTMRHELIAIEQAEEWLSALVEMVDRTSESRFDREVEEVFQYVSEKQRTEAEVYRAFKPGDRAERMLRQLVREGRIAPVDGSGLVRVVGK